jgi:predicted Zn-dependent protease
MSARARVLIIVAVAAGLAVAGTVGITLLQSRGQGTTAPGAVTKPRQGRPPVFLEFGVRADREATQLSRAANLLNSGKAQQAGAIFARYHSLQAEIGAAFARWPDGSLDELKRLVASHPESPSAQFHLGMAYYWSGRVADAARTWQRVEVRYPDAPESVEAENVLYPPPKFAKGLPFIVTPLAPNDPVVRTAAAMGVFTKRAPVRAFGLLGPLTAAFPHAAVVRFHLAILLVWTRQPAKALEEFRLAIADEPRSIYGKEARQFVAALRQRGTK